MRDKESVTQIFILYGYEKAPGAIRIGGFLFSSKRQHITYLLGISNPNSFPKRYFQTLS